MKASVNASRQVIDDMLSTHYESIQSVQSMSGIHLLGSFNRLSYLNQVTFCFDFCYTKERSLGNTILYIFDVIKCCEHSIN